MRSLYLLSFVLINGLAQAQLEVPTQVVLDGPLPADRQVTGLAAPTTGTSGVSAEAMRLQATTFGIASGSDQLTLALDPPLAAYTAGMVLSVQPSQVNNGAATLNVDGLGDRPIQKNTVDPLDSADLQVGIPVQLVYDGVAFQLIGQGGPGCPPGFFPISRDACVESLSHDSLSFYASTNYCVERGQRLCSFAEWYQACAMPGGILPTIMDFEWVDEAANDTNKAKRVGLDGTTLQVGCKFGSLSVPLGLNRFRCCYDR